VLHARPIDDSGDAQLITHALRRAGCAPIIERITSPIQIR
jgi:hypothetical protein